MDRGGPVTDLFNPHTGELDLSALRSYGLTPTNPKGSTMTDTATDWEVTLLEAVFQHQRNAGRHLGDAAELGKWSDAYGLPEGPGRVCWRRAANELHEAASKLTLLVDGLELLRGDQLPDDAEVDHLLAQLHPNRKASDGQIHD
jgi:hypothetical protein